MSRIEVSTAHNIVVRFELATLGQRFLACFLDLVILCMYSTIVMQVFTSELFYWLFIFPVWSFYHLTFEIFNQGQSLGKKVLKIRVVTLQGSTAKVNDYLIRWAFRIIEVLPCLGTIATLFISSSDKNQRIGDMLANTSVVKNRNDNKVQLKSLKEIVQGEEILYPAITQFTDADMLLVKQAVTRYNLAPHNLNNKAVIDELCSTIADKVRGDRKGLRKIDFLNRVLFEYVVLTR